MDYELKYIIAICLIVKIAALSPEFSISEEKEKPEQISSAVEASFFPSSPAEETLATSARRPNREMVFDWGLGMEKLNRVKSAPRSREIKETPSFETCENKLELLENSLKWRDIRKTLRWLERLLVSNKTTMAQCHKRKRLQGKEDYYKKGQNFDRHSLKYKDFLKSKILTSPPINWVKNLTPKKKSPLKRSKKIRNNRSKKEKLKSRKSRFEKKYFHKSEFSHPSKNATILKPNSVLFDLEEMFFKKKSKSENVKSPECHNGAEKISKNCLNKKNKSQEPQWESRKRMQTENWSVKMRLREHAHENNKTKLPKQKPWPHFVYHRVSSNFLHPESTGHSSKKSAYIAISVVTASKPESTDSVNNT